MPVRSRRAGNAIGQVTAGRVLSEASQLAIIPAMLVRIGVLALAGVLGLLGAMLVARGSPAAPGLSDTTVTTAASTTVATTGGTSTATSTSTPSVPPPRPVGAPLTRAVGRKCFTIGGVMLLVPGRPPIVLKPVADPAHPRSGSGPFVYPRGGAVVSTQGVAVRAGNCGGGARASVISPSLFGGAVTASVVTMSLQAGRPHAVVQQLRVAGKPVVLASHSRIPVAGWAYATKGERRSLGARNELQAALAVHLREAHAGLPRGATVVVGFAVTALAPRHLGAARHERRSVVRRREHAKPRRVLGRRERRARLLARLQRAHRPLKLKPRLGLPHYVFPVAGPASFGDTYGAARSDVSWHHGDDIFAPLGTPVVAVADGTLNRVGWERLGGWRLWVRDRLGNEFYYAHLSGYTNTAIRRKPVTAGEVLGFVGNTGDAFGTPFHLHFEIHPRSLLPLHYDGAVDPTTYLERWQRLAHERASRPLHPRLPRGAARVQAIYVYRELLAARGLIRTRPPRPRIAAHPRSGGDFGSRPAVHRRPGPRHRPRTAQEASAAPTPASTFTLEGIAALFLVAPAALGATLFRRPD